MISCRIAKFVCVTIFEGFFRINFDVACNMDFRRYPVDVQYCEIKFESFGFQSNQVNKLKFKLDLN
jgi:hypothetical protein